MASQRTSRKLPVLVSSDSAPSANHIREHGKVIMAKPETRAKRLTVVYGELTGTLGLPVLGSKTANRTRVDYENTPEGALVRRAQAGDETAFQEIVERYQSKVFSIIHGIVRQRNDVEDIAQQVFTKIYFSMRNFDFRSSLITWIYKITVNECFDYLRKKKVRKLVYESDMSEDEVRRVENSETGSGRGGSRRYRAGAPGLCGQTARARFRGRAGSADAQGS